MFSIIFKHKMLVLDHFLSKNDNFRSLLGVQKKTLSPLVMNGEPAFPPRHFLSKIGDLFRKKKTYKKVLKLASIGPNEKSLMIFQEKSAKNGLFWRKRKREGIGYQTKLVKVNRLEGGSGQSRG